MKPLFYNLPQTILRIFYVPYILWHITAILLTALIVSTGFDWYYFLATRNDLLQLISLPAIILGGILPIVVPLTLIALGKIRKNKTLSISGFAIGQAALLGSLISSFYKTFTGRIQPDMLNLGADISKMFQFGIWKHGIFWGWPSSHTTIAFAMAFAVVGLFPKKKLLVYGVIIYAFYIGLGISTNIHWFSDFVAGAIIGTLIGYVVGKSFSTLIADRAN